MDRKNNKGFTLVEILVALAIIGILGSIAAPRCTEYMQRAKEEICNINCVQIERMYEMYLALENIDHSETVFVQYIEEYGETLCPNGGKISYVNGKVQCSVHTRGGDASSDEYDGSVPFL